MLESSSAFRAELFVAQVLPFLCSVNTPELQSPFCASSSDPRAIRILAKAIYRKLRVSGLPEECVMAIAGELLGLITDEVKNRRNPVEDLDIDNIAVERGSKTNE